MVGYLQPSDDAQQNSDIPLCNYNLALKIEFK